MFKVQSSTFKVSDSTILSTHHGTGSSLIRPGRKAQHLRTVRSELNLARIRLTLNLEH
jgi:hypothetical protein